MNEVKRHEKPYQYFGGNNRAQIVVIEEKYKLRRYRPSADNIFGGDIAPGLRVIGGSFRENALNSL